MTHVRLLAPLLAGLVAAVLVLVSPESPEMVHSGDGVAYLGAAESLVRDGTYRIPMTHAENTDSTEALVHFPPGFSTAIAVPHALGSSPLGGARIVRAFGAFLLVGAVVLVGMSLAGVGTGVMMAMALLATPSVVFSYLISLSEGFFLGLLGVTVALMVLRPLGAFGYGLTAAAALITRYVGVSLTGAVSLWAFAQPGTFAQRARRAVVAGLPSVVVQLAWMLHLRNEPRGMRPFGMYGELLPVLRSWAGAAAVWLAPEVPNPAVRIALKILLFAAFTAMVIVVLRRSATPRRATPPVAFPASPYARLLLACALIIALYSIVYVLSRLFADWAMNAERRYLGPVDALFSISAAALTAAWWRFQTGARRYAGTAVFAVWLAVSFAGSVIVIRQARADERIWGEKFARSGLIAWARADGSRREIYTNWGAPIYLYLHRPAREIPHLVDGVPEFGRVLAERRGVLVYFREKSMRGMMPDHLRARFAEPDSIAAFLRLREVARFPDGVVWESPAPPGAALPGQPAAGGLP